MNISSSYAKILRETNFHAREFTRNGSKAKDGEKKREKDWTMVITMARYASQTPPRVAHAKLPGPIFPFNHSKTYPACGVAIITSGNSTIFQITHLNYFFGLIRTLRTSRLDMLVNPMLFSLVIRSRTLLYIGPPLNPKLIRIYTSVNVWLKEDSHFPECLQMKTWYPNRTVLMSFLDLALDIQNPPTVLNVVNFIFVIDFFFQSLFGPLSLDD